MSNPIRIEVKDMEADGYSDIPTEKQMSGREADLTRPEFEGDEQDETTFDEETEAGTESREDLRRTIEEMKDRWLRSQAEFENFKKRLEREKQEFCKFANESVIKDLLPTLDNLDRAMEHVGEENGNDALRDGLELTRTGLMNVLKKNGLEPIVAVGEKFDPNFHEAVMQQESAEHDENVVLEEIQKGYLLHGRLVRPSIVVISKTPA